MAWTSLLKNVASGAAKKMASGAKKVKGKGKQMAENMMGNKKEKGGALVVREKTTTLAPMSSGGALDTPIQKPTTKGSPLDRIDSALLDIMNTLKSRRKLMLNKSRRMRSQDDKEKKAKREGILERMKEGGKKMLGVVASNAKGWWERLQTFLLMTLVGSLVASIKKNWEAIQTKIGEFATQMKELWENLEPIVTPIWQIAKWIVKNGFDLIKPLLSMGEDKAEIEKGTDEVSKGLEDIKKKTSWIEGLFKKSKEDTEKLKDEDYSKEFKDLEKMQSVDEENPGDDISKVEQIIADTKDKIAKIELDLPKFEDGAVPVKETGPAMVHKGEVIIPSHVVQMAGGPLKIESIINMMSSSSGKIKENPLQIIGIMQEMAQEFAPMGEQLPVIINEKISESKIGEAPDKFLQKMEHTMIGEAPDKFLQKMEHTINILKEQTGYENPSATKIFIPVPTPSQSPTTGGGDGGSTMVIPMGSTRDALNRYVSAVIQKALY